MQDVTHQGAPMYIEDVRHQGGGTPGTFPLSFLNGKCAMDTELVTDTL